MNESRTFHYQALAEEMADKIRSGDYTPGSRLPSLRSMHALSRRSIATVYQAYMELERQGMVEARNKSGFYVLPPAEAVMEHPRSPAVYQEPIRVSVGNVMKTIVEAMGDPNILQFGGASPGEDLLPIRALSRIIKQMPAEEMAAMLRTYAHPAGLRPLRDRIAKRMPGHADPVTADDIVITGGCLEAISCALRAVADPGDTIAVETPTFHSVLQLIEDLDMLAIEIPTHGIHGIDPDKFRELLDAHPIKACILMPSFQNPLGFCMDDNRRKAIVAIATEKQVPLIEDDIYGELHFGDQRPIPLKAYDREGWIIYCSSFSKTLSPGLRVGWIVPGRFFQAVHGIKMVSTVSDPGLTQAAVARYLETGAYDRHLRRLRRTLQKQVTTMLQAIARYFPEGTRASHPAGGLLVWIQLPGNIDGLELFHKAASRGISILPGTLCTSSDTCRDCIRISCGAPWSEATENGVRILGTLVAECRLKS